MTANNVMASKTKLSEESLRVRLRSWFGANGRTWRGRTAGADFRRGQLRSSMPIVTVSVRAVRGLPAVELALAGGLALAVHGGVVRAVSTRLVGRTRPLSFAHTQPG